MRLKGLLKRKLLRLRFGEVGYNSYIEKTLRLNGSKNISIGSNVHICKYGWLAAVPLTGEERAHLIISDGVRLGDFNHIWATKRILIEPYACTANHVYISDNSHGYDNISMPIYRQPIVQLKEVVIGESSWLGENVCVIGASVGKHCVIGANSVVTKDIPDYCVAVGAPAKVVKRYDFERQEWIRV